jgi:hypothetical protein
MLNQDSEEDDRFWAVTNIGLTAEEKNITEQTEEVKLYSGQLFIIEC